MATIITHGSDFFTVQPTKRVKQTGARQEIIRLIKEANPGTVFDNLNWDDFSIISQVASNDGTLLNVANDSSDTYPLIHLFLNSNQSKYTPNSSHVEFKVLNTPHINDVFLDIFNNTTEFKGIEFVDLKNEMIKYIPNLDLEYVRNENDNKTTVYRIKLKSTEDGGMNYSAFIDGSTRKKELLEIKLHKADDLVDVGSDSVNKGIEYSAVSGIYESV